MSEHKCSGRVVCEVVRRVGAWRIELATTCAGCGVERRRAFPHRYPSPHAAKVAAEELLDVLMAVGLVDEP